MRRPAPPPPADEVIDLDYGNADAPTESVAQPIDRDGAVDRASTLASGNELDAVVASHSPPASRGRKLLAYETDDFDPAAQQAGTSQSHSDAVNDSRLSSSYADAVPGPSSPTRQLAAILAPLDSTSASVNGDIPSSAGLNEIYPPQQPPPPAYPPPALPHAPEQYRAYAYDPNAPEFRPSLHPPAPPTVPPPPEPSSYYAPSVPHGLHHGAAEGHAYPSGSGMPYPSFDPPYDPHAPYHPYAFPGANQPGPSFPPYPPFAAYHPAYPADLQQPYSTQYPHPQMSRQQEKRLRKQQKKKEKKLLKRKAQQARNDAAAAAAGVAGYDPNHADAVFSAGFTWSEDDKAQAVDMIRELHTRGVPPERLVEKGVPLSAIELCCAELSISPQGQAKQEPNDASTPAQPATLAAPDSAEGKSAVLTTPADDEMLAKQEQGIALTPLEELRRKVLASRLAKAAAAGGKSSEVTETQELVASTDGNTASSSETPSATTAFDRTATSGEADALLSQIGETIRSLLRPDPETAAALRPAEPPMEPPQDPAPSSRKRSYRDVDAVDNDYDAVTADLAGDHAAAAPAPSRRQRISYADNFSRAPKAPSGEVDLSAPVPDQPDFTAAAARSPIMTDAAARRRRPVAADFDTSEYHPQIVQPDRFLDVPSGLNTVIDLSDDELDEEELDAFEVADGWTSAQLDVDPRDVVLLRQKTASEHYDNFCALNGLQPARRANTPQQDVANGAAEASRASTPGGAASKEALLAQLAAAGSKSAGSSTPSHEQLLRKELEIKQLMRKIQMMEERKSKQPQASLTSPSVSPMPTRVAPSLMSSEQQPPNGAMLFTGSAPKSAELAAGSSNSIVPDVGAESSAQASESGQVHRTNSGTSSSSSLRLDPALQKQRESLLALLASKRKNATTVKTSDPNSAAQNERPNASTSAPAQEESMPEARSENTDEPMQAHVTAERKEVSTNHPAETGTFQRHAQTIDVLFLLTSLGSASLRWCRATDHWCRVCFKA